MDHQIQLLQELDQARAAMRQLLAEIDVNKAYYPGWTIQQVLAHLAGWDEAVTASLRAYLAGGEAAIASFRGIDDYNARSVETRGSLQYEQVRKEWELARDDLKAAIRAIPPDQFETELLTPWGQRLSVIKMVNVFIHHEFEHVEELRGLMEAS